MNDGEIWEYDYPWPNEHGNAIHRVELHHYGREAFSSCMYTEFCKSADEARALFELIKVQRADSYRRFAERERDWKVQRQRESEFRMAALPQRFADFCARLGAARARHGLTP